MKAVRFVESGHPAEIVDIKAPTPGPGEVVIKVAGAGVCHSDLHVLDHDMGLPGPFTLGHENAGWISALGDGVTGWKEGDAVAVYGPWGCGRCHTCQTSMENYCENHASLGTMGGGLGSDGGMAEYMRIPSPRLLVSLQGLDPIAAAPLSDAALTPYHAIKAALPMLTPEATVLVVGIGGLGHMAVQILRAMTSAQLIAADIDDDKLAHAKKLGAAHTVNTGDPKKALEAIRDLTGPRGITVALDFVGAQPTIDLCVQVVGRNSRLYVVGLAGGVVNYEANNPPYGCQVMVPYWGSRTELMEVIALAAADHIRADVETFPLEQAVEVYQRLRDGKIHGRAVLLP
ncbi:NAD(P)-dependent alcohol dehydrogenase [Mesorhizobium xinjiangense]|uniref:NAD(P)-dependent alcohol dehydrogenase n=1 Tax=Mesorhizobium xinjiangense TaxID=2678685 RepID=UPI0012EE92D3|nr:NAD(P)-dependent alcohol dehydrogenase [Mesorhizobium xinjiangense]